MIYGIHGPYVPPSEAVCTFPDCQCLYVCPGSIPRTARRPFLSPETYAAMAIAAVLVALAVWAVR
jgi:hypothetical protein